MDLDPLVLLSYPCKIKLSYPIPFLYVTTVIDYFDA